MWYHIPTLALNTSFYASADPSTLTVFQRSIFRSSSIATVTHNLLVAKSDFSKRSWYPVVYRTSDVELVDLDLRVVGVANVGGKGGAFGQRDPKMKADPTVREMCILGRVPPTLNFLFRFFSFYHT